MSVTKVGAGLVVSSFKLISLEREETKTLFSRVQTATELYLFSRNGVQNSPKSPKIIKSKLLQRLKSLYYILGLSFVFCCIYDPSCILQIHMLSKWKSTERYIYLALLNMEAIRYKSKSNPLAWFKAKDTSDIGINTILKFVFIILRDIHEAACKSFNYGTYTTFT